MHQHFLYHRVVPNMHGTILFPLNKLKTVFPDAYDVHVKKYIGRETLLNTQIPTLNCLWNDVIHFTAVSPKELSQNLAKAGFDPNEMVWKRWFKIPAELLDPHKTIVCLYQRDISLIPDTRNFTAFDLTKFEEYRIVPDETIEYYKEERAQGKRPLLFHRVPHILFKGTIETKGLEIIEI